jgi:heme/copper-type cytochrome/quinol oxidase subunit 2
MPLLIFWICVLLCVVSEFFIIRSAFRSPAGTSPNAKTRDILWSIVPAILLAALLLATWRAIHMTHFA